ncbi:MAG: prephenate dehydratase [Methanobacteriaceae archaeon]|jgi:prephenate dehydratase|nr:prephenate dehydratase [Methanobacteriaceae archaeon]
MNEKKQVGYLGPEGTFSQEAVLNITDNNTINKPYPNILSIFEALEDNQIDEAVVPIENSTEGSVVITLDALTRHNLKIKGELELPIRQNLLVQKGRTLDDINVICSHQQAIAQCRHYINRLNKPVHAMPSTANAARYVTELSTAAVIGNEILSEKYNLEIIAHDIQDYSNNVTRFVILDKEDINKPTGNDKTSIIISLKNDNPGSLYEILYEFAKENINLTKIESRPSKQGMGKYLFFIDIVGHRLDPKIKNTLAIVEGKVNMFKILGSYSYDFGGGD